MTSTLRAKKPAPRMSERRRLTLGWASAIMLTLMMLVNWADKAIVGLAAGPLMKDLGLTPSQLGGIGSIFFLVFCITPLFVGFIANRVSSRWLMAILVLMWSVAQAQVLLAASYSTLLLSRIILGAAEGPTASLMHHHLHKWFKPAERAMPSSIGASGSSLGLAIAAPVLTFIIATQGWRAAFFFMAVVGMVWVVLWLFIGHDGPLETYEAAEKGDHTVTRAEEVTVPYRKILGTGTWLGGFLGSHFAYWALALYSTWLPLYLQQGMGLTLQQAGGIAAIPPLIGFAVFLLSGFNVDQASRRGITMRWSVGLQIGVTSLLAGISLIAAIGATDHTLKVVLLSLAFGLPNSALSLVFLSATRITPVKQRGATFAFTNVAFTSGGIIVPFLAGFLIERSDTPLGGYHTVFMMLGVALVIVGIVCALIINPERDARKLGLLDGPIEPKGVEL